MHREPVDAFVNDFLVSLKPALTLTSSREALRYVRSVCDEFQERVRGDLRIAVIPLAFWTQFATDFVDAYMTVEDDAEMLLRLRAALRSRMGEFARAHNITLEDLNA